MNLKTDSVVLSLSAQVNTRQPGNFLAISDAQASYAIQDYNSFSLIFSKLPSELNVSAGWRTKACLRVMIIKF